MRRWTARVLSAATVKPIPTSLPTIVSEIAPRSWIGGEQSLRKELEWHAMNAKYGGLNGPKGGDELRNVVEGGKRRANKQRVDK